MSDDLSPLPVRPAATVMLVRDTAEGISVFLMRRHLQMRFLTDGLGKKKSLSNPLPWSC